jgi:cytochrome P450
MPGIVRTLANSMLSMDEPDHKRLRDIVDEAFRRRAVLEMEPHIQAIGDQLADELFAEGSPADLVERYARKLPLSVICELLGLPLADRPKFVAWAGGFTRFTGALGFFAMIPKSVCDEALYRTACRNRAPARRGRVDRRDRARREGGRPNQPRRNRLHGVPAAVRRPRDHDAPDQRIRVRASEESRSARLARGGLEPRRSGGRGILALHHAGAVHQTALRAEGRRPRRRQAEKGDRIMPMLAAANMDPAGQSPLPSRHV